MFHALKGKKGGLKLLLAGTAALALSGCADSGRLDDPFGNPFHDSARYDRAPTGTINAPPEQKSDFFSETFKTFDNSTPSRDSSADLRANDPPRRIAPMRPPASIESSSLPAPRASSPAPTYSSRPAPRAPEQTAAAPRSVPARVGGWSIEGGAPVVLAQGENARMIADRYGVPVATLLELNGYRSASQVQPGARLTIPVYSANHAAESARPQPPREARVQESRPARMDESRPARMDESRPARMDESRPVREQAFKPEPRDEHERVAEAPKKAEPRFALKAGPKSLVEEENEARDARPRVEPKVEARMDASAERKARLAEARAAAIKEAAAEIESKRIEGAKAQKLAERAQAKLQRQQQAQAAPQEAAKARPAPQMAQAAPEPARPEPIKPAKQQVASAPDEDATARTTPAGDSANPEFRWPARGRVIQAYGNSGNDGINIAVPEGTAVKAAESGVVTYAGSELKGYGNLVLIHHPNGFDSVYANNGSLNVKRGDTVKRGQTIAMSGQSGNVSSPQLHFELRKGHKPVDPTGFLAGL